MIIIVIYIFLILSFGLIKKINCFNAFEEGATEGINLAVKLFLTIIGLVWAINIITNSGLIEITQSLFTHPVLVPELILQCLFKPLSWNSSLIMMNKIFIKYHPDSTVGKVSSLIQGCSDTTIYIITIYFGSVNITKTKYAFKAGLLTDLISFIIIILIGLIFL
mgnify:CR=1 FL=1